MAEKTKNFSEDNDESAVDVSAAAVLLARLRAVGVDYIFANSGTDFPPIIEALAAGGVTGLEFPQTLIIPHESAAMAMAHGVWLATGRAQAVMAHTNVGLANCALGAINAARDNVPILLFSGRTPVTESDRFGARTVPIGWGQEMRDQAALVREATKWDYELRFAEQTTALVDRAMAIANSQPAGPVYLSLPREVLCSPCSAQGIDGDLTMAPVRTVPPQTEIFRAAEMIKNAKSPMIIAQRGTGSAQGFAALTTLTDDWGIPVSHYWATRIAVPTQAAMCAGSDPMPWLGEADVVLVLDSLAPWWPDRHQLADDVKVIQAGPDPLFSATPVRSFPADISLMGDTADIVLALADALGAPDDTAISRHGRVAKRISTARTAVQKDLIESGGNVITKAWVGHCLSQAITDEDAIVVSELGVPLDQLDLKTHGTWFQEPHSGGLGWGFPCAMGIQLADRDRLVVAPMGDGSYMFANPVACHQIAEACGLPILIIILNNAEWGAIRQSVTRLYPDGHAVNANRMPLTALTPSPEFTLIAQASRAWTAKVTDGAALLETLRSAIKHIREKRTHALVEVAVAP